VRYLQKHLVVTPEARSSDLISAKHLSKVHQFFSAKIRYLQMQPRRDYRSSLQSDRPTGKQLLDLTSGEEINKI